MSDAGGGVAAARRWDLVPHPAYPPVSVRSVGVEIVPVACGVAMRYSVDGADALVVPDMVSPARADELWKTTCFELFLQSEGRAAYFEFNFSPSTRWAAYRFDGHRAGMRAAVSGVPPKISRAREGERFVIEVELALDDAMLAGDWRMGLTAVIEEMGAKSYWALDHAPGAPDFHNRDCFTARLAAPDLA